jgi:glycosyltransferase involved in cell wall biosynthesis
MGAAIPTENFRGSSVSSSPSASSAFSDAVAAESKKTERETWIALLGCRDEPVDGVEDYCDFLSEALGRRGTELKKRRVAWMERGWMGALQELWRESRAWSGRWVLMQYTALGWSRRGFPLGALAALWILRRRGARAAVVFHEHRGQESRGLIGWIRKEFQNFVVRRLYRGSARSVFTIPLTGVEWLGGDARKAAFVPIGANIPAGLEKGVRGSGDSGDASATKTVVVFCLTAGANRAVEVKDTVAAARAACGEGFAVRLIVVGRSTAEVREEFERELAGSGAEVRVLGMRPAEEVAHILRKADAQLFVCGRVSQRRGSALAGIACGLPIVGYAGEAAGTEVERAGLRLAPYRDAEALGRALVEVLKDGELNARLRERSRAAQAAVFSWDVIATKFADAMSLRVLIYAELFLPVIGGVQTSVNLLTRGLASANREDGDVLRGAPGVEVTLATGTRERAGDDSEFPFRIVRAPSFRELVRLIRGADVVHAAGPCLVPMAMAWWIGKPFVVEHHGYQAICPNGLLFMQPSRDACPGHFQAKRYEKCLGCRAATVGWAGAVRSVALTFPRRWLCEQASTNIGITRHVCERHGLPRSRTIYYGIERTGSSNGRATVPLSTEAPRGPLEMAYVGRLVAEKGLPLLLDAAKRLKDEGVAFRLMFIGDGPERGQLERCVDEFGLRGAVSFTGDLWGPALERAVGNVAVVVMPSVWEETAGLSAIEQMMRGRVVVAADIGGLGEVVGDAGLKFPARDSEALTARLREAAMNCEEMLRCGSAARERAEKIFGVERMVREHEEVYREVAR